MKSFNERKRIVNVDMVYIVNHVKVKLNVKGITFHVFAFSGVGEGRNCVTMHSTQKHGSLHTQARTW